MADTAALPGQSRSVRPGTIAAGRHHLFPVRRPHHASAGKTVGELRDQLARGLVRHPQSAGRRARAARMRAKSYRSPAKSERAGPARGQHDVPLTRHRCAPRSGGTTADADTIQRVRSYAQQDALRALDLPNRMLDAGDTTQNVMLQNGDVIKRAGSQQQPHLRDGRSEDADSGADAQGPSDDRGRAPQAGGILDTDANPRQIFVMRGMREHPTTPDVYRLDMTQPDAIMLSAQFQLQPLDVAIGGHRRLDHVQPRVAAGVAERAERCST